MNTVIAVLFLTAITVTYVALILALRRLVRIWEGRDVMTRFRPSPRRVARTERELGVHHE